MEKHKVVVVAWVGGVVFDKLNEIGLPDGSLHEMTEEEVFATAAKIYKAGLNVMVSRSSCKALGNKEGIMIAADNSRFTQR